MFCSLRTLTALAAFFTLSVSAAPINILDFPQPKNAPDEIYAVTEIPAGSNILARRIISHKITNHFA